ncbi:MAG TPA: hypothetical protein VH816_03225 [Gaiellaceae bacterium]|jgi:hypothetical protein
MKLALLAIVGLLVFSVPSGSSSTRSGPVCTSGASSVVVGEPAVTEWYPPGCVHP